MSNWIFNSQPNSHISTCQFRRFSFTFTTFVPCQRKTMFFFRCWLVILGKKTESVWTGIIWTYWRMNEWYDDRWSVQLLYWRSKGANITSIKWVYALFGTAFEHFDYNITFVRNLAICHFHVRADDESVWWFHWV